MSVISVRKSLLTQGFSVKGIERLSFLAHLGIDRAICGDEFSARRFLSTLRDAGSAPRLSYKGVLPLILGK